MLGVRRRQGVCDAYHSFLTAAVSSVHPALAAKQVPKSKEINENNAMCGVHIVRAGLVDGNDQASSGSANNSQLIWHCCFEN